MNTRKITAIISGIFIYGSSFAQWASTPCTSGPLPSSCTNNQVVLNSSFTNSGVTNPTTENGSGCSSVGSDITAGNIGGSSGTQDYDGWYTTVADANGDVDVYAAIVTGDPVVGIYTGSCSSLTLIACDDDGGTGLDANASASGLTPGQTVWIRVWDYAGGTGTYDITASGGTPPANDDCVDAEGLTVNSAPVTGTNYCSTVEVGDWNDCESNTENNVWYSFTTTSQGDITVNFSSIDCFGSGVGIDVTVFSGTCAAFSSFGCTSVSAGSSGNIAEFTGPADTYYVMVDGNNSGGATALCDFDIDVDFVGCSANAGTNTSAALINLCAGDDANVTTVGSSNTNVGTDPCIGWGLWVESDPLGVFPGMTNIGDLPTGNNPAGPGGDGNYVGTWDTGLYPAASGPSATLPSEANGVTYYVAPVTLSNCATGGISTSCFDIGNVTQIYHNPEIVTTYVIDCDPTSTFATPLTQVTIAIAGGLPMVDGSNFTVTNNADGTESISSIGDGGTMTIDAIPDGGDVDITFTDGVGCTHNISISAIDATAYCPTCGADAGTVDATQTGTGTTTANNGTNGGPFILCYGDEIDLVHNDDYTLPADLNLCGDPPGPATFDFATIGSCQPGMVYGIFTDFATTANPFDDANFSGFGFVAEDFNDLNDGSMIASMIFNGIPIVNNTIILYPVTADVTDIDIDGDGDQDWAEDIDGDGCVDSGFPFSITYLNDIAANASNTCEGPQFTLTGGSVEFYPGNYAITNNAGGTITGTPVTHNGAILITGLNNGDSYDFDVEDPNGCVHNFTGTYNYTQPSLSINNLATDFCLGDAVDNFTATPTPVTVTAGTFDIDFVSDGFTDELTWQVEDNSGTVVSSGGPYGGVASGASVPTETTSPLDPNDGPFTLVLFDAYNDGQDGTGFGGSIGTTTVTNNVTGNIVATTSGNWGATTTLNLGNFVSTTGTITGTDVTDNGDGTASFNPLTVGTHTITYTYDNGEGCTYTETQNVTVHQVPLLGSTVDPEICAGETILLSDYTPGEANGLAGTGTWYVGTNNSGATASTGNITPSNGDQFYYEFITTAGSCTADASITVTVNALPTATASSNSPICVGDQLDLTGGATGLTYSWTGPNSYSSSSQSPTVSTSSTTAMAGTYTLEVNDGNCTNTADVTVTVNTLPTVTAASNSPVCEDDQLDLTGGAAGLTYSWTGPNSYSSSSQSPTVSTSATTAMAGTYNLEVNDGNCTNDIDITVTVNTLPTVTASSNSPLCVGEQLDLTGGAAGLTYAWTGPDSYASPLQSPTVSTSATTAMTGTYNLEVNDGNCTNDIDITVTVNALPAVTASSNSPICVGDQLDLTGGAAGLTYSWTGPDSYASPLQSPTVNSSATTTMAGTYNLEVNDGNCTNDIDITVTVNTLPAVTASSNSPVCVGEQLDLTGGAAGLTYAWTGPNTYASPLQSPTVSTSATTAMAGTYNLEVNDGNCTNDADITVTVNALPAIPTIDYAAATCLSDGISTIDNYSAGNTYTFNPAGPTVNASGVISGMTVGTLYTVIANNGDCDSSPSSTFSNDAMIPSPTVSAGTDVCVGSTITLSPTSGGSWSSNSPLIATINNAAVVTGVDAGSATFTFTDGTTGCSSTTSTVTVNALPTIDDSGVSLNNPSACGATDGSITGITATGAATISYTWNGGTPSTSTGDLISIGASSNNLLVTDGNGCSQVAGPYSISDPSAPAPPTLTPSSAAACVGGSVTISIGTPDAGATYTWSGPNGYTNTGSSITINNISTNESGNYDVSTTISGCTTGNATSPVAITVNTLPVVDVLNPITVDCNNPVINLDGSNSDQTGVTYSWTTTNGGTILGTGNTDTETTSTAGDYTLTVENTTTGCIDSETVTVTENNDTPTADASTTNGGQLDCSNNSLVLDGSTSTNQAGGTTGITYEWYNGATLLANTSTHTVNAAGTYTLIVTESSSGCNDQIDLVITQDANVPSAIITDDELLTCATTSITLDGSTSTGGTLDYEWFDDAALTNSLGMNPTLGVSSTGTYYLEVTNPANNCASSTSVIISEDVTIPNAVVVSPVTVNCLNNIDGATLDGSGSDQGNNITFSWATPNGTIIGDMNLDTAATITAGDYDLTVTNSDNGCNAIATVVVSEDLALPTADAGTDVNFPCGVTDVALDGSNSSGTGITYSWSGTGNITNGTSATPDVDATGTYTITVMGSNGCTATDDVDVIPDANAPVADAGSDITIDCSNITYPFAVTLDGSGSDIGMTYTWTGPGNITFGSTVAPSVDAGGVYQLEVLNTANNCNSFDQVEIIVDTVAPTANAGTAAIIDCNSGLVTTLDASGSNGGVTYTWSTTNGTIDSQTGTNATVSDPGDYQVLVEGSNGCLDSAQVNVTLDTVTPVISIATPSDFDCNTTTVTLDASATTGNNVSYSWSSGGNLVTEDVTTAGTYTLTATNDNGCSSTGDVTVNAVPLPVADFTATPTSGSIPLDVAFTNTSTGTSLSHSWDFGDGNTSTDVDPNNIFEGVGSFTTILTVTDAAGCSDTASVVITTEGESELIIPNIFSPNGDGVNDIFNVEGTNIIEIEGIIMNRWGQNVFEWTTLEAGWDGYTVSGVQASEGTYYYLIKAEGADGEIYDLQGPIQLVK